MKRSTPLCDCDTFLKTAWRFEANLTQCIKCRLVWIGNDLDNGNGHKLCDEDLSKLQWCVKIFNVLNLDVQELAAYETYISHGLCRLCLRDKILPFKRKAQRKNGFFECFATAENGHCSQTMCEHYDICVVDQQHMLHWKERLAQLC